MSSELKNTSSQEQHGQGQPAARWYIGIKNDGWLTRQHGAEGYSFISQQPEFPKLGWLKPGEFWCNVGDKLDINPDLEIVIRNTDARKDWLKRWLAKLKTNPNAAPDKDKEEGEGDDDEHDEGEGQMEEDMDTGCIAQEAEELPAYWFIQIKNDGWLTRDFPEGYSYTSHQTEFPKMGWMKDGEFWYLVADKMDINPDLEVVISNTDPRKNWLKRWLHKLESNPRAKPDNDKEEGEGDDDED